MAGDTSAPGQADRSPKPTEEELLLIEQFYKDSVVRYGSESEQVLSALAPPKILAILPRVHEKRLNAV